MAKLSARGAWEVARFRHGDNLYVVRSDGAVLMRWARPGERWRLWARARSAQDALRYLERMGAVRASGA